MEVAEVLVRRRLLADGAVNSNLVVEVLVGVFGDLDESVSGYFKDDSIVSESNGGLVSYQEIATARQQSPSTPSTLFNG